MDPSRAARFSGESATDRAAWLLAAEADLRVRTERVAALRRALPPGGPLAQDDGFTHAGDGAPVRMTALFAPGRDTRVACGLMVGPQAAAPCPMCRSCSTA